MKLLPELLPDMAAFTDEGRRLLVSLGAVERDPLRVQAEQWLDTHTGPATPATAAVRRTLGPPVPPRWVALAAEVRGVK